jgi:hypothetical protein
VNIFGRQWLSRPSAFSAKSPDRRHGTAIASQPGFRESGDSGPSAAAFSDEYGEAALLHRCPEVARRRILVLAQTGWEREQTSVAGKQTLSIPD